jgi:hypothetical protein
MTGPAGYNLGVPRIAAPPFFTDVTLSVTDPSFPQADPTGTVDSWAAIQAAINRPAIACTITIPRGSYLLSKPLLMRSDVVVRLRGDGVFSTRLFATAVMQSVIQTTDGQLYDSLSVEGIGINCSALAGSGFRCEQWIHGTLRDVLVTGHTSSAVRFNNGYSNLIEHCFIFLGVNGIDCGASAINHNVIRWNQIYALTGFGIQIAGGGIGVYIGENGIEQCEVAGIIAWDVRGFDIIGNYFERNGGTRTLPGTGGGVAFTVPEALTVRADIFIMSSGLQLLHSSTGFCTPANIKDNVFTPYGQGNIPGAGLKADCCVFTVSASGLNVVDNHVYDSSKITAMVGLYSDNAGRSAIASLKVEGNTDQIGNMSCDTIAFLGVGRLIFCSKDAHNVAMPRQKQAKNYAPRAPYELSVVSGATGSIVRTAVPFKGLQAFEITPGDKKWGATLALANYPELLGRWVYFAIDYQNKDAASVPSLSITTTSGTSAQNDGSAPEAVTPAGTWAQQSVVRFVALTDTTLAIGIVRGAGGAANLRIGRDGACCCW